jgi:hypothetical protein
MLGKILGSTKSRVYATLLIVVLAFSNLPHSIRLTRDLTQFSINAFTFTTGAATATPIFLQTLPSYNETQICFPHNSPEWINGPRWTNNHNDPLISNDNNSYIHDMILSLPHLIDQAYPVLTQTLAINNSLFLNLNENDKDDDAQVRRWSIRLAYLAVHYHQHVPALAEAQAVYNAPSSSLLPMVDCVAAKKNRSIGVFDYECPGAQYLVAANQNTGLGSNVDFILASTLQAGLSSGRIVHFGQNMPNHTSERFRQAWPLASCHRHDYQCVFTAPSPCVPTMEEMQNGYMLNDDEKLELQETGKIPESASHHKVIYMPLFAYVAASEQGLVPAMLNQLKLLSHQLVDALPATDARIPILRKAANDLAIPDGNRTGYVFKNSESKSFHAMTYYALRPWPSHRRRIDQMFIESLPSDFDPNQAVGLPIRGMYWLQSHLLYRDGVMPDWYVYCQKEVIAQTVVVFHS